MPFLLKGGKGGEKSLAEKHPEIQEVVTKFIKQYSPKAHLRRRDSVMYSNGVTLQEIADHISKKIGYKISKLMARSFMLPPSQDTVNGRRYKGLIQARNPPKKTAGRKQSTQNLITLAHK